jgi:hypothetical protein
MTKSNDFQRENNLDLRNIQACLKKIVKTLT